MSVFASALVTGTKTFPPVSVDSVFQAIVESSCPTAAIRPSRQAPCFRFEEVQNRIGLDGVGFDANCARGSVSGQALSRDDRAILGLPALQPPQPESTEAGTPMSICPLQRRFVAGPSNLLISAKPGENRNGGGRRSLLLHGFPTPRHMFPATAIPNAADRYLASWHPTFPRFTGFSDASPRIRRSSVSLRQLSPRIRDRFTKTEAVGFRGIMRSYLFD